MIGVPSRPRSRPQPSFTRDHLSFSSINAYQRCPLAFYFRYVAQLAERTVSSNLVFGSAIHRAVQFHFDESMAGNEPPSLEALLGEFDAARNEYDPQSIRYGRNEDRDGLLPMAERVLAAFQSNPVAKPSGVILGIEEELRGPVVSGCPDLLGRIDLIVETSDSVVITDWKTSRARWSRQQVDSAAPQLLLYHELVKSFAPRKRLRLQFAVLNKSGKARLDLHEVPVYQAQVDRTKRIVERIWQAIDKQVFYPAPSPAQCPTCAFREPCRQWTG